MTTSRAFTIDPVEWKAWLNTVRLDDATPDQLAGAKVSGRVVGTAQGPKIDGFTYKRRTNQRRRYGHRQRYQVVEITAIAKG